MKACLPHTAIALAAALLVYAPDAVRAQSADQPPAAPEMPGATQDTPAKEPESGAPIESRREADEVEGLILPEGEQEMPMEEPGEVLLLNEEASGASEPAAPVASEPPPPASATPQGDTGHVAIPETEWGEAASIADPPAAETLPSPTEVAQPPQPAAPASVAQPPQPAPAPVAQPTQPPAPVQSSPAEPRAASSPPTAQREPAGAVSTPAARRPTIDTAPLMARGQTFLRQGDIASARLFFERAAEQGDAAAMTALARTFDPIELRRLGVLGGIRPDSKRAMELYQSAAAAGDATAQQSMTLLSDWIARAR
jgi:hypothetical protein